MFKRDSYDCIVVGGGPAGSTAGTILADHGRSTLVLERIKFPRHHIGESLIPQTYWIFKRIGMLEKMKASDFVRKESVQFVNAEGKDSKPFYFYDRYPHECSITWQVPRDRFDKMMLDNAREHGAEVHEGVNVTEVVFEGERAVGVNVRVDGTARFIPARVVIDASGTSGLISRHFKLRYPDKGLRHAAVYAYYKGAHRDEGRNAGATIVIRTPDRHGWFWYIPLPDDITSVGIVSNIDYLFDNRGTDPMATFLEEVEKCPGVRTRVGLGRLISHAFVINDFSYRSKRASGDGWVLVGDALGFLDPLYSTGVLLALQSAMWAADGVHEALEANDLSAQRLGRFAPKFMEGMQRFRQLVYTFYDPEFSFAAFTKAHPEYHDHVVRILIGDVFNDEVGEVFTVLKDWVRLPEMIEFEGSGIPA